MNPPELDHSLNLAILGGKPAFINPLPVGQLYFPEWEVYERRFRALFEGQYYTNQGPLTDLFEARLAERLQVRHAVCVTNATIGLSMVAEALGIKSRVIVPAFTFIATVQSIVWSKLTPVFCDVDRETHHFNFDQLQQLLDEGADAILWVNLWAGGCDVERLELLAQRYGVALYFDSAHSFGCTINGRPIGGFGQAEVFSFHATKVLSTTEGGCITTNDDNLAERLRNIRSSYGVRKILAVTRTANGRMSEAQAAIGLLSMEALNSIMERNRLISNVYCQKLSRLPGLKILVPQVVDFSNNQYLICEIDEQSFGLSRDSLLHALKAENIIARRYFSPGAHRCPPFNTSFPDYENSLPVTDRLCSIVLQLPLGARVDEAAVSLICNKIILIQQSAEKVRVMMECKA